MTDQEIKYWCSECYFVFEGKDAKDEMIEHEKETGHKCEVTE